MSDLDLASFLSARLDEKEQRARRLMAWQDRGRLSVACAIDGETHWLDDYEPTRVLREVEAKRAIAAIHSPNRHGDCSVCITERVGYMEEWSTDTWPCRTVRLLAAIWDGHPDFRPEWKP